MLVAPVDIDLIVHLCNLATTVTFPASKPLILMPLSSWYWLGSLLHRHATYIRRSLRLAKEPPIDSMFLPEFLTSAAH